MLRQPRTASTENTEELELFTSEGRYKHHSLARTQNHHTYNNNNNNNNTYNYNNNNNTNNYYSSFTWSLLQKTPTGDVWRCCCGTFDWVFFGIDAPLWPIKYGLKGGILLLVAILLWTQEKEEEVEKKLSASSSSSSSSNNLKENIGFYVLIVAFGFLFMAFMFVFTSLVFKQCLIKYVLNQIPWRGNEKICDLGCGSGIFLINALLKASPNGYGIGIDKWDVFGQVGICRSNYEQCLWNAKKYRVDQRMKLITGSAARVMARELRDEEFDVVVTSWFLHVVKDCAKQTKILDEIIRVLKPNGYLLFIDIWNAATIQNYLEEAHHCRVLSSPWLPMFCTPTKVLYVQKVV